MPIYLFVASIANGYFVYQSTRDVLKPNSGGDGVVLFALSISELTWVVPCCVQCFFTFADVRPREDYQPTEEGGTGCDVMGFYSVFASISGQLLAMLIAAVTYDATKRQHDTAIISRGNAVIFSMLAIFLTVFLSLFPFYGIGEFKYSGEGFCYFDWTNTVHIVVLELVSIVSMIVTIFFFLRAYVNVRRNQAGIFGCSRANVSTMIAIMALNHIVAWFLWIPAGFMGSTYDTMDDFPSGYMLTGAILGHGQALVNPFVYGWIWRAWMQHSASDVTSIKATSVV